MCVLLITTGLVITSVVGWDGKNTWTPRGLSESGNCLNYAVKFEEQWFLDLLLCNLYFIGFAFSLQGV